MSCNYCGCCGSRLSNTSNTFNGQDGWGATPAKSHLPLSVATLGLNSTSFDPLQRPVVTSKLSHSFIDMGLTLNTDGVAYAPDVHFPITLLFE